MHVATVHAVYEAYVNICNEAHEREEVSLVSPVRHRYRVDLLKLLDCQRFNTRKDGLQTPKVRFWILRIEISLDLPVLNMVCSAKLLSSWRKETGSTRPKLLRCLKVQRRRMVDKKHTAHSVRTHGVL